MFTGTAEDLNVALQRMLQEDALTESAANYIRLGRANNEQERAQLEKERRDAIKWAIPLAQDNTQRAFEMEMLKDGLDHAQERENNYFRSAGGMVDTYEGSINKSREGFHPSLFRGIA